MAARKLSIALLCATLALVTLAPTPAEASVIVRAGSFHHRHYHPYRYSFHVGYWGFPYYYHYPHYYPYYYPHYYPYHPGYAYHGSSWNYPARGAFGALDLNVKPKKAEVYVDGDYIGTAGEYDGFPSYLWLEPRAYEVAFYLPGYGTETRSLTVRSGLVVKVALELAPGEAVRPERAASAGEGAGESAVPYAAPAAEGQPPEDAARGAATGELDLRREPGRVRLVVEPGDASVYLDGRFLGLAQELARLHSALLVNAGGHVLEVVRPGRGEKRLDFEVSPGEEIKLEVSL